MTEKPIRIPSDRFRIDLEVEVRGEGPDGTLEIEMRPDPRRYEWQDDEKEGRVLFDRQTGFAYPEEVVSKVVGQMEGAPIHGPPTGIPTADDLLAARKAILEAGLARGYQTHDWADPASEAFAARVGEDLGFAVVCVDLVGSTRLQAENAAAYNVLVPALAREIADVSSIFGGLIIKYTGDGAIVGFPEPFNVAADMAFDAATAVIADVYSVLNPLAKAAGLPPVHIRVGADANEAAIKAIGSTSSRLAPDVLGLAVSMSAKVESQGEPGELWVGQTLYENLHVSRQEFLSPAPARPEWRFVDRNDEPYCLYRFPMVPPLPPPEAP